MILQFYFFLLIIFSVLDFGRTTYNRDEVETRLPVIYPSYLYLTVPPKKVTTGGPSYNNNDCLFKDVMFNCKVKSATNLNISWSFNNKSLQSTANRR